MALSDYNPQKKPKKLNCRIRAKYLQERRVFLPFFKRCGDSRVLLMTFDIQIGRASCRESV